MCVSRPTGEGRGEVRRVAQNGGPATAPIALRSWYCVWCQNHYQGEKYCIACNTGIYSIEEESWRENYT
ncbi:putative zinc ribbon protein [Serratia sp. DD3]|uniref:putative zinc ribbon protein n=1 Tax=Serratia sp. DD3 TaxID=1410619 RepID=UPI00350F268D